MRSKVKRVLTKVVGSDQLNAYQTYIDAIDNPFTRRNYELHFQEFRRALGLSQMCNELLEMDGRELENLIVQYIKDCAAHGASTASMKLKLIQDASPTEQFSFPPGSSTSALQEYHNARRRKRIEDNIFDNAPRFSPGKIVTQDEIFAIRRSRKVFRSGAFRRPTIVLPEFMLECLGIDWKHKDNARDILVVELSADRSKITLFAPGSREAQESVDARVFMTTDSDEYARTEEEKEEREQK